LEYISFVFIIYSDYWNFYENYVSFSIIAPCRLVSSLFILNCVFCLFSLTCKQPFEGAEGNLRRLLEKNTQWFEQHCNNQNHQVEDTLSIQPAEHIHRLIARFLLLIDVWFFDRKSLIESHQVRFLRTHLSVHTMTKFHQEYPYLPVCFKFVQRVVRHWVCSL
jgi:hypothetical protein